MGLGFIPEAIHFGQCRVLWAAATLSQFVLNICKTTTELGVGTTQCIFGVDLHMACSVDDGKQQVAKLGRAR